MGVFATTAKNKYSADGVGAASASLARTLYSPTGTSCRSLVPEKPMGVIEFNPGVFTTSGAGAQAGKAHSASGPPEGNRIRSGYSFALAAAYPGATVAILKVNITAFSFFEFYTPQIYLSATDDSGLYGGTNFARTWENHTNTLLQTAFGDLSLVGVGQELLIPFGDITSRLGSHISFVQVTSTERAGAGAFPTGNPDATWNAIVSLELR